MENEVIIKKSGGKITLIISAILISAFLVYYAVMSSISPGVKLDELKADLAKTDGKEEIDTRIFSDSAYLALLKEKAFLQSKTLMAQTDSIYLTINLKDSTSSIEISGVTVHTAKISSYDLSNIFRRCDDNLLLSMLSAPLSIKNSIATIKKEPVMIKLAPKDTSEYKPDIIPDTSLVETVNYILEMTNGTRIYVYQEEDEGQAENKNLLSFDFIDRLNTTWNSLKSVISLKVPEYHPYIRIRIPRADGKIIYRALPRNGQVTIYT
jgi:hypothetical protein